MVCNGGLGWGEIGNLGYIMRRGGGVVGRLGGFGECRGCSGILLWCL